MPSRKIKTHKISVCFFYKKNQKKKIRIRNKKQITVTTNVFKTKPFDYVNECSHDQNKRARKTKGGGRRMGCGRPYGN